jgi:hypothetical protein
MKVEIWHYLREKYLNLFSQNVCGPEKIAGRARSGPWAALYQLLLWSNRVISLISIEFNLMVWLFSLIEVKIDSMNI